MRGERFLSGAFSSTLQLSEAINMGVLFQELSNEDSGTSVSPSIKLFLGSGGPFPGLGISLAAFWRGTSSIGLLSVNARAILGFGGGWKRPVP